MFPLSTDSWLVIYSYLERLDRFRLSQVNRQALFIYQRYNYHQALRLQERDDYFRRINLEEIIKFLEKGRAKIHTFRSDFKYPVPGSDRFILPRKVAHILDRLMIMIDLEDNLYIDHLKVDSSVKNFIVMIEKFSIYLITIRYNGQLGCCDFKTDPFQVKDLSGPILNQAWFFRQTNQISLINIKWTDYLSLARERFPEMTEMVIYNYIGLVLLVIDSHGEAHLAFVQSNKISQVYHLSFKVSKAISIRYVFFILSEDNKLYYLDARDKINEQVANPEENLLLDQVNDLWMTSNKCFSFKVFQQGKTLSCLTNLVHQNSSSNEKINLTITEEKPFSFSIQNDELHYVVDY